MNGADRMVELAKGAMLAAATVHAETERLRWEAWRLDRSKGKKRWEPIVDRSSICATFDDIFSTAVEAIRRESARGE